MILVERSRGLRVGVVSLWGVGSRRGEGCAGWGLAAKAAIGVRAEMAYCSFGRHIFGRSSWRGFLERSFSRFRSSSAY